MMKEKSVRLEYHLKFNKRNPQHVKSALALASVDKQYKSSFIALAIEHYMKAHPMGISLEELMNIYRQSERSYTPKVPILGNLQNSANQPPPNAPTVARDTCKDSESNNVIDKAMNFYDIS